MEYSSVCENSTCAFFPTERYTGDEAIEMISESLTRKMATPEYEFDPDLLISSQQSEAMIRFVCNLPEARGNLHQGIEWLKIMNDSAHFDKQELYFTICPGCQTVHVEVW